MAAHTCAARASTAAVRTWRTGAAFERLHGRCSQRLSVSHGFAVPIRSRPISNVSDGGRAPDGGDDGKGREGIKNDGMRPLSSRFTKRSGNRMAGNEDRMPMLTLEHFLLRDKCVKLWRDFLRASRNIPNPVARRETVDWLRNEHFEGPSGLRQQADITRIRELLVAGNVALKRVCGPMELVAALNPEHGSFPKLVGRRNLPM